MSKSKLTKSEAADELWEMATVLRQFNRLKVRFCKNADDATRERFSKLVDLDQLDSTHVADLNDLASRLEGEALAEVEAQQKQETAA